VSPVYGDPQQLALLLDHIADRVNNEPDHTFTNENVHGSARALYEALGHRLGEAGHNPTHEDRARSTGHG
jgi:hypothetical protein